MDQLGRANDYLEHVDAALSEARRAIEEVAGLTIPDDALRETLAKKAGQAHNAIGRAATDLQAHRLRYQRSVDANLAEALLETLLSPIGTQPQFAIAVLPLPIETDRLSDARFDDREFAYNFRALVTTFNNTTRRGAGTYLMEVPGGMSWDDFPEAFTFTARSEGATEDSHVGRLYRTGAFAYTRLLYWAMNPPKRVALGLLQDHLEATLAFVADLYAMLKVRPRAIAVQFGLFNAQDFNITNRPPLLNEGFPLGPRGECLRGAVAVEAMPLESRTAVALVRRTLSSFSSIAETT